MTFIRGEAPRSHWLAELLLLSLALKGADSPSVQPALCSMPCCSVLPTCGAQPRVKCDCPKTNSDNGREFTSSLITEVTSMWPKLNIVHGKPRHSQSQGSVERANRTVEEKLACWMKDNGTKRWSEGLRFVQWQINTQVNSGIGRSPYKAMFGTEPKLGLATTTLPSALTSVLHTEEELRDALDEPSEAEPGQAGPSFLEQPSTSSTSICLECGRQVEAATECPCQTEEPPAAAERRKARVHQSAQAERMLKRARSSVAPISVGDNVTVGIPDVDRSRIEHRNLICVVLEEKEDGFILGCKQGRLGFYTRNQLEPCRERHLKEADVPEKATTVREAARAQSGGKGQGFLRCSCAKRCLARCKCVRAKVACNSRCHHSKTCNNV